MSEKICLPTEHYMFLMFIFVSFTLFYIYKMQNIDLKFGLNNNLDNLSKQMKLLDEIALINKNEVPLKEVPLREVPLKEVPLREVPLREVPLREVPLRDIVDLEKRDYLNYRDKEAVYNDFKPPEKRLPEYQYPEKYVKRGLNIPTRGLPENYSALGALTRKSDEKVLQLFGRQKFPGSNQWEYYVSGADTYGFPNKMPISIKGDREIEDKQKIQVPWLDKDKGDFEVNLFNYDVPRYNPYDY